MSTIKQKIKKAPNIIMKNSIITSVILCLFFLDVKLQASKITKNEPSHACLELDGMVEYKNKTPDNNYKVELIQSNFIIKSVTLNDKNSFKFKLQKNTYYAIRISKKGFVTRTIRVHTALPEGSEETHHLKFDTELLTLKEVEKSDTSVLDFPAAIVSYDQKINRFYYDEESDHIK